MPFSNLLDVNHLPLWLKVKSNRALKVLLYKFKQIPLLLTVKEEIFCESYVLKKVLLLPKPTKIYLFTALRLY